MQKKLINNYKDFFKENDLILSSYFSFAWTTSGIGNFSQIPRIKQKLNKQCFIGINKTESKGIILKKIYYFDKVNNGFQTHDIINILSNSDNIITYLEELTFTFDENIGFEINIFSEVPRGYSLGFSGTVGALIISGIYSYFGKADNDLFGLNILENKEHFNEIREKAFEFELISKNNNTAGESSFSSFVNSSFPFFYNINNFLLDDDRKDIINKDYKIITISNKNNFFDKNIDYILVFSGLKNDTEKIQKYIENDRNEVKKIEKYILEKNILVNNSHLQKILINNKSYENINNTLIILNSQLLYYFFKFNENGKEKYIFKFLDNLNKNRISLKLIEKQIDFDDKFIHIFEKIKKYSDGKIGISSLDSSKHGGMYLIATQKKDFSSIIESVKKINKFYPDSEIIFNSNKKLDDNKKYGIKIEQFLSKNILGKFSNKKGVFLNYNNTKKIIEYSNLEKLDFDIIIDSIKNKLYINNKKLTSKDIHSQTIASEVLIKLIKSTNGKISNFDISFGSYRENKVELNGKVILPLNKIILENLNYVFPLKIKGSIGKYEIKLGNHNLKIAIIQKIN